MDESILAMQRAELESLQSIFGEELMILSDLDDEDTNISFVITLQPAIQVRFEFPRGYPDTQPCDVSVSLLRRIKGQNTKELEEDLAELGSQLLGSPAALMLMSRCQAFTEAQDASLAGPIISKVEEVDLSIKVGRLCTPEVFAAWAASFAAEAEMKKKQMLGAASNEKRKATGKQQFESSLKNTDWSLFDGDDLPEEDETELA